MKKNEHILPKSEEMFDNLFMVNNKTSDDYDKKVHEIRIYSNDDLFLTIFINVILK